LRRCASICRAEVISPDERTKFCSRGSRKKTTTAPARLMIARQTKAARQSAKSAISPLKKRPLKPPRLAPAV
jgi:hypothetical protein